MTFPAICHMEERVTAHHCICREREVARAISVVTFPAENNELASGPLLKVDIVGQRQPLLAREQAIEKQPFYPCLAYQVATDGRPDGVVKQGQ